MRLAEALEAVRAMGASLILMDDGRLIVAGAVDAALMDVLGTFREQLVVLLELRQLHRSQGFDETDVVLIEHGLLEGSIKTGALIVPGPSWVQ